MDNLQNKIYGLNKGHFCRGSRRDADKDLLSYMAPFPAPAIISRTDNEIGCSKLNVNCFDPNFDPEITRIYNNY